jgi:hypothetical protein
MGRNIGCLRQYLSKANATFYKINLINELMKNGKLNVEHMV